MARENEGHGARAGGGKVDMGAMIVALAHVLAATKSRDWRRLISAVGDLSDALGDDGAEATEALAGGRGAAGVAAFGVGVRAEGGAAAARRETPHPQEPAHHPAQPQEPAHKPAAPAGPHQQPGGAEQEREPAHPAASRSERRAARRGEQHGEEEGRR